MKDTELLNNRLLKLQQDFDSQLSGSELLMQENNQKAIELRVSFYIFCKITISFNFKKKHIKKKKYIVGHSYYSIKLILYYFLNYYFI